MTASNGRIRRATNSALAYPFGLRTAIMELFDIGPGVAITVLTIATGILAAAIVTFVRSAPPRNVTITTGPEDSTVYRQAQRYAKILADNGVQAKILPSNGSIENLERLTAQPPTADLGMVQSGATAVGRKETANPAHERLMSMGSISYQPLLVFYRGAKIELLSSLAGKRVAIGPIGSGTRRIALAILAANGIEEGGTTKFFDLDAEDASKLLQEKKLDAAFVMGESASGPILRTLMRSTDMRLYDFGQSAAYARKFDYLNVLHLPPGSIDLAKNIPAEDVTLVGPMVELIARKDLHPALVDLVVEAATQIHSRPGMWQKRGEFPAPIEHTIAMSDEAVAYYKSGKSFLYRMLPFWLASLLSRLFVVILPVLVILIPAVRSVPAFFRWIAQLRIRRRYRELRLLEQNYLVEKDPARKEMLRREFDRIEDGVNEMRVRASFADQFYGLRGHIDYVRRIVQKQ